MLSSFKNEWKPFEEPARSFAAKEQATSLRKTKRHDIDYSLRGGCLKNL